ncbi:MAG TPA: DUF3000 domain-containing protein [Actinomycetes bacterium]|nr:DUF3000 domain-containing protein [Actinomycetes bacterium]
MASGSRGAKRARSASDSVNDPTELFAHALRQLREVTVRAELHIEEAPAPARLAPHAVALTGDVTVDGDDLATGRFVLLHDPAGHDAWAGTWRVVSFVRAELETDLAADPMLTSVGWAWLTEALEARAAQALVLGGTVTRVSSESFGTMSERPPEAELELRASWTPAWDGPMPQVAAHLLAWADLLCTAAGLAPLPPGIVSLPNRRATRKA